MGVLLVEQNAAQALRIADLRVRAGGGADCTRGSAKDLTENENVQELYLGVTSAQPDSRIFVKRKRRWN